MENVNVNKICWNITEKCNRKCKHCFRFIDVKELSFEDNIKILMKLNEMETKMITWTGGEATLYPNIELLIKKAHELGINNNLITNGTLLNGNPIPKDKYVKLNANDKITIGTANLVIS